MHDGDSKMACRRRSLVGVTLSLVFMACVVILGQAAAVPVSGQNNVSPYALAD